MRKSIITDQISMDLETALKLAKENGYECVELHGVWDKTIEDCTDQEVTEIKRLLIKYKMTVSNLATTIFFMCKLKPDYVLKSFSPSFKTCQGDRVEEHLEGLMRACEIAKALDCPNIARSQRPWIVQTSGSFRFDIPKTTSWWEQMRIWI